MRIAILGLGGFGRHLAREVTEHPDATIAAAVDVSEETLAAAADRFDLDDEVLFTDAEEMYDRTALDAVIIATPPAFHRDQILTAFDHGYDVLCEKPVVIDLEELDAVEQRADETGCTLMAGYQRHLDPAFIEGYERWQEGDAEPTFITGELTQDWNDHFEKGTNWRTDPDIGGRGHLFSVGTHVVESLLWMTGLTPIRVYAEMNFYDEQERIDTVASLTVRFDNGSVASLGDAAITAGTKEWLRVWDDEGGYQLSAEEWGRPTAKRIDVDGNESAVSVDYEAATGKVEAFVESISSGTEPPASIDDVRRVTALLDATYESAQTGEPVAIDLDS